MIFQIYDLLAPLVAKASTDRYGEGKAETRNVNVENCLPTKRQVTEEAVLITKKVRINCLPTLNQITEKAVHYN